MSGALNKCKFQRIEWHIIPSHSRERFVNLLREVGVQHVCHTETVIACFIEHFAAKIRLNAAADGISVKSCLNIIRLDIDMAMMSCLTERLVFFLKWGDVVVKMLL